MPTSARLLSAFPLLLVLAAGAAESPADPPVVAVGAPAEQPAWAREQLAFLADFTAMTDRFFDRFTDPDTGHCTITTDNWGGVDDIAENIAHIDKFLLVGGSDRSRERYVSTWKGVHRLLLTVINGFENGYYKQGYDMMHASELLTHLWGAMDFAPDDADLTEANRLVAQRLLECVDPKSGLFTSIWLGSRGGGRQPEYWGRCSTKDLIWINAWTRAWMHDGDEKWRTASLRLLDKVAEVTKANDGIIPGVVGSDGTPVERWWDDGIVGYQKAMPGIAARGWHSVMTAIPMITGDTARLEPFATMLAVQVEKGDGSKIAGAFDGTTWSEGHMPYNLVHLLDRLYDLTWDERHAENVKRFGSDFARQAYFGEQVDLADQYRQMRGWNAGNREKQEAAVPDSPDSLWDAAPKPRPGFDWIHGVFWSNGFDKQRCGGFLNSPVRWFRADGGIGLPPDVAVWIHRVGRDEVAIRLHNSAGEPRRALIAGGHHGSHRITTANGAAVDGPLVLVDLPAKSGGELVLGLARWAYRPTHAPQRADRLPLDPPKAQ